MLWKMRATNRINREWSSSFSYTQAAWILFIWELTWHMGIRESHTLCIMHVIFLKAALYSVACKKWDSEQCSEHCFPTVKWFAGINRSESLWEHMLLSQIYISLGWHGGTEPAALEYWSSALCLGKCIQIHMLKMKWA